jgi:hypothetical protein
VHQAPKQRLGDVIVNQQRQFVSPPSTLLIKPVEQPLPWELADFSADVPDPSHQLTDKRVDPLLSKRSGKTLLVELRNVRQLLGWLMASLSIALQVFKHFSEEAVKVGAVVMNQCDGQAPFECQGCQPTMLAVEHQHPPLPEAESLIDGLIEGRCSVFNAKVLTEAIPAPGATGVTPSPPLRRIEAEKSALLSRELGETAPLKGKAKRAAELLPF